MENQIKCSFEEHKETNAIKFCPECRIYMCNKCENHHSSLFKNHHLYNINKEDEIFTEFCKEKGHQNKLRYFCKNHNQLCCAVCIAKLNEEGEGQHKDCDVCYIEKIKEEKKNKLKENIKSLEELQNKFNENMNELKEICEKIEKDKDQFKSKIQNIFTKIRNTINEREDKLIEEIDNLYKVKYFDEDIIKNWEKLPKQIKLSLEKGKLIDKEWDNNNLYSYINDCINIENNIKKINVISENSNKFKNNKNIKIEFYPKEETFNQFLETINSFGKINLNSFKFRQCPKNINNNRAYSLSGEHNNIITKIGNRGWTGAICEDELDKSIEEHKWKIKIIKSAQNKLIMIGVASSNFDIYSSIFNNCGYYFYCYNSTLNSGPPYNYGGIKTNLSKINDEIIVVMNMKKRTLKFLINNEDKGYSYTNIPIDKPLFPSVYLIDLNDSVEISGL